MGFGVNFLNSTFYVLKSIHSKTKRSRYIPRSFSGEYSYSFSCHLTQQFIWPFPVNALQFLLDPTNQLPFIPNHAPRCFTRNSTIVLSTYDGIISKTTSLLQWDLDQTIMKSLWSSQSSLQAVQKSNRYPIELNNTILIQLLRKKKKKKQMKSNSVSQISPLTENCRWNSTFLVVLNITVTWDSGVT